MLENEIITTLQNFIYKQTTDLENVQRDKKKEWENLQDIKVKISPCQQQPSIIGQLW
jgi:hypothetical protein